MKRLEEWEELEGGGSRFEEGGRPCWRSLLFSEKWRLSTKYNNKPKWWTLSINKTHLYMNLVEKWVKKCDSYLKSDYKQHN